MSNILLGGTNAPLYNLKDLEGYNEARFDIVHKTCQCIRLRIAIYLSDLQIINGGTADAGLPTGNFMTHQSYDLLYNIDPYSSIRRVCDPIATISASFEKFWELCEEDEFEKLRRYCTSTPVQPPHLLQKYYLFFEALSNFLSWIGLNATQPGMQFMDHPQQDELKALCELFCTTETLINDLLHMQVTTNTQWRSIYREHDTAMHADMHVLAEINTLANYLWTEARLDVNTKWNIPDDSCKDGLFEHIRGDKHDPQDVIGGWLHAEGQHPPQARGW